MDEAERAECAQVQASRTILQVAVRRFAVLFGIALVHGGARIP